MNRHVLGLDREALAELVGEPRLAYTRLTARRESAIAQFDFSRLLRLRQVIAKRSAMID
jgi:hypothetical protein